MITCHYRLSSSCDPEERLEDAVLAKALHDVLGPHLQILPPEASFPEWGLCLGRQSLHASPLCLSTGEMPYWTDPAFVMATRRTWSHEDLPGAERAVAALHAAGKDVFVKSTRKTKDGILRVPRGQSLAKALGDWVYSFIDRPPCLLVQEAIEMRFERRFLFLDGELVTQSTVGMHLTPMSRIWEAGPGIDFEDLHLGTPQSRRLIHSPNLTARMTERAIEIASSSVHQTFCMDLCLIGDDATRGHIEPIEWNPFQPGQIGLYGCDPRRIADGVRAHLEANPGLYQGVPGTLPEQSAPMGADLDWTDLDA